MSELLTKALQNVKRSIARTALTLCVFLRLYGLIGWLFSLIVKERTPAGESVRATSAPVDDRVTMLVFCPDMFRGDVERFAETGRIRVLLLEEKWLTRLMFCFYPTSIPQRYPERYLNPSSDDPAAQYKRQYRDFLRKLLPLLFRRLGVDCVIGHHFLYLPNIDWGPVSEELGVPYIACHSESMYLSMPHTRKMVSDRVRKMGTFEGSHIIVYNADGALAFADTGFVGKHQITNLGSVRMDDYVRTVGRRTKKPCTGQNRKLTFFIFDLGENLDMSLYDFFKDVHATVAKIAARNPDLDVTMKAKRNYWRTWSQRARTACAEEGIDIDSIPNLHMTCESNPHELILESEVVCALNSTTLLEAGIAGIPVVVPYFGKLRDPKYDDRLLWRTHYDQAFDVGNSREEFESLLLERIENPVVDEKKMKVRRELFEEYISSLDGRATERHIDFIQKIVAERKQSAQL